MVELTDYDWILRAELFLKMHGGVMQHQNLTTGEYEIQYSWKCPKCKISVEKPTWRDEILSMAKHMKECIG